MLSPAPRVTMRQIAACFGVSHATVSLALRNHPRISSRLRKEIQDKALEMGYHPDPLLTVLAHYRHHRLQSTPIQAALAWINCWEDPRDLRRLREFDAYWQGASEAAHRFGYRLEEFIVNEDLPLSRLEKILITRNIKGILIPPHRHDPHLEKFNWNHFSAVRLGRSVIAPEVHVVSSDQTADAMLAFRKVAEKGYSRIGYVGGDVATWTFTAGFLQAQMSLPESLRLPPLLLSQDGPHHQGDLSRWIRTHRPQALITSISRVPALLESAGYHIPRDIAVAALSHADGNISAGIDQHSQEVGRVATLTVISLINDFAQGIPPIFRQILIEGTWLDGPSLPIFRAQETKLAAARR
jgi:LacI family transcriptional regulator